MSCKAIPWRAVFAAVNTRFNADFAIGPQITHMLWAPPRRPASVLATGPSLPHTGP